MDALLKEACIMECVTARFYQDDWAGLLNGLRVMERVAIQNTVVRGPFDARVGLLEG